MFLRRTDSSSILLQELFVWEGLNNEFIMRAINFGRTAVLLCSRVDDVWSFVLDYSVFTDS